MSLSNDYVVVSRLWEVDSLCLNTEEEVEVLNPKGKNKSNDVISEGWTEGEQQ